MASVSVHDLPALKRAYEQAVTHKAKHFWFNGATMLVDYAKYLIEYLESVHDKNKPGIF